jgi:Holliday junction DNA helicase RuvA
MIAQIKGKIVNKNIDSVIVDVSGVGYRIFVLPSMIKKQGDEVLFFTHQYIREDQMTLYGFLQEDELRMFEMLISVSGIGPKAALGILTVGSVDTIKRAIVEGRSDILKSVSGVGKKIAERAILELKEKVTSGDNTELPRLMAQEDDSAVGALVNLGYRRTEAVRAIQEAGKENQEMSVEEKIKHALKHMGK